MNALFTLRASREFIVSGIIDKNNPTKVIK